MGTSGWTQWTEAEARATVVEWRASGLTVKAFCAARGYSDSRLRVWRDRFDAAARLGQPVGARVRKKRASTVTAVAALVPVRIIEREAEVPIEVVVRGGQVIRVLRGFDTEVFTAVVHALEGAC